MKDAKIMKYVPKAKLAAIKEAYHDDDGYWIILNEGYINSHYGGQTIHEDTISNLRYEMRSITKRTENT